MKICFIPIDNRPVCYNLAKDIASIDTNIEFFLPPRKMLGDLKKTANINGILSWLKSCPKSDRFRCHGFRRASEPLGLRCCDLSGIVGFRR